jgi:hypothetical protein
MSLSIAIAGIVTADVALVALLAFVMSRATRLTPHLAAVDSTRRPRTLRALSGEQATGARGADRLPIAA